MSVNAAANMAISGLFFRMEMASYFRAPMAIFWTFVYPVILFFLLNAIFGGGDAPSGPPLTYSDYLITGLAVMTLISTALFGFAVVMIEQRAAGNLQTFATMPFSKSAFFWGFVGARLTVLAAFLAAFLFAFSHLAPDATALPPGRLALLVTYLMAGAFALAGCALLLASAIQRTATAHAVANIVNLPLIFLSDLFLPAALFPLPMLAVLENSPIYLFVNDARAIYGGALTWGDAALPMAIMAVAGLSLLMLAGRLTKWTVKN